MGFSGGKLVIPEDKIEADQHLGRDLKWMLNIIWLTHLKSPPETFLKVTKGGQENFSKTVQKLKCWNSKYAL